MIILYQNSESASFNYVSRQKKTSLAALWPREIYMDRSKYTTLQMDLTDWLEQRW